ncbi:hypothetical protein [Amorphus coralli]|uniref:hypothetical protein n=1 Tax=Amorphus coralli TaxID=340680 RepID=UPI00037BA966|nr:hypothetical protein [Amorphus coralli]
MADPARARSSGHRLILMIAVAVAGLTLAACGGPSRLSGVVNLPGADETTAEPIPKDEVTVAFEPFTGIPGNIADELAGEIAAAAEVRKITLVKRLGSPATYRVKGFLSAISSDNAANIVYVFDVFDASGKRLHRITGERQAGVYAGDPWSGVGTAQLSLVATDVIFQLDAWLMGGGR